MCVMYGYGLWSVECGVWSVERGVRLIDDLGWLHVGCILFNKHDACA